MTPAPQPITITDGHARISVASVFGPTPKQHAFLTARNRRRFFCAGRGAGKTRTLVLDALLRTLVNGPVSSALLARTGTECDLVVIPLLLRHAETMRRVTGINPIVEIIAGEHRAIFRGGGSLEWRGYEQYDKLRSRDLAALWLDEVCWAQVNEEGLWRALLPTIRVVAPFGGLAVASSPNGMVGITKRFRDAQDKGDTRWHVTRCSSWDNPHLARDTIEDWRATMSKSAYLQEIMAFALKPSSVVFAQYTAATHRVEWDWRLAPQGTQWVVGVDWGISHAAALIIQVTPDGRWYVIDELIAEPQSYQEYRKALAPWVQAYTGKQGPALFAGDRAVPVEQRWAINQWGARAIVLAAESKRDQSIRDGVAMIQGMLDPEVGDPRLFVSTSLTRTVVGHTAGLLTALEQYRFRISSDGVQTDYPLKDDVHDHVLDALRYAVVCSARLPAFHGGRVIDSGR